MDQPEPLSCDCGRRPYATAVEASSALRNIMWGGVTAIRPKRFYRGTCGFFHLTSSPKKGASK